MENFQICLPLLPRLPQAGTGWPISSLLTSGVYCPRHAIDVNLMTLTPTVFSELGNKASHLAKLSIAARRRESVLALHVAGLMSIEIARRLNVSARTVARDLAALAESRSVVAEALELTDEPVDAQDLHLRLSEMFDADLADIVDAKTGEIKPIHEWPLIWRQGLAGEVTVEPVSERSKDGGNTSWDVVGQRVKVKRESISKLLELLGRLKSVDALVKTGSDAKEVAGAVMSEIDKRIAAGRQRAATTRVVATLGPATDVVVSDAERARIHDSLEHCRKMAGEDQ